MKQINKLPSGGNPAALSKRPAVGFRSREACEPIVVRGQTARALIALKKAGASGITAQEVSSWALRLAAYVMELRRCGLDVETVRETHRGGRLRPRGTRRTVRRA